MLYSTGETDGTRYCRAQGPNEERERYRLRGNQTTEMVFAMREFEIHLLPPQLLADFILLRSQVYAINERIPEVYTEEKEKGVERPVDRTSHLDSARKVYLVHARHSKSSRL